GAVTMADHLSSGHGSLRTHQPFDAGYPARLTVRLAEKGQKIRAHQAAAGRVRGHLLLRAWTGSGKTEGGLLWAAAQVEDIVARGGGVPRLFYTLPYLASINAMTDRLADRDLRDHDGAAAVGVSHSRAASYHLARSLCGDDETPAAGASEVAVRDRAAGKALARAEATRLFRELVRVGTPYQLLRGVLAGAVHASVLLDSANSVFILDELHAYDPKRLGYILATAGFWAELGGRVAVLSATAPNALVRLVRESLVPSNYRQAGHPGGSAGSSASADAPGTLTVVEADYRSAPHRHRLHPVEGHLTDPRTIALIRERLAANQSVLVVANNIADAQTLYEELAEHAPVKASAKAAPAGEPAGEEDGAPAAWLLHSRFRRVDRAAIENAVYGRFRADAQPADQRPGLVVATQVVEVSLDVDFEVLFTSGAPLDALAQRFGRVNRTGARPPADVFVCRPEMRSHQRGGNDLYADGVYPQQPTEAAWAVLDAHRGEEISEAALVTWLDGIYDSEWGQEWAEEVRGYRREWATTFLAWDSPFLDRSLLAETFDTLFDGVEGVLLQDRDEYAARLKGGQTRGRGRLLAADLLIPLPSYARGLGRWDRDLDVLVVDGEYSDTLGLTAIRPQRRTTITYQLGELI
ncbi:CRISPR-associated helicase Cas3', partial [Frankia sp. CcWB2]